MAYQAPVKPPALPRRVAPPPDLQPWVEMGVIVQASDGMARFPALAESMLTVRFSGQVVDGPQALPAAAWLPASTLPRAFQQQGEVVAVGLVLRPAAVPAVLQAGAGTLGSKAWAAEVLFGARWCHVEDRLRAATTEAAQMQALFDFVRQCVAGPQHEARRVRLQAQLNAVRAGLEPARTALGWSRRQLERSFRQQVGISPKQFQAVQRVKAVLHDALTGAPLGADLACRHGYFDQSHMARDLRRYVGAPLGALLSPPDAQAEEALWPLRVGTAAEVPWRR